MLYKGQPITESEITVDVIREIIKENSFRFHYYKFDTFLNKDGIYNYQAILDAFFRYLHSKKRKKEIGDIEDWVIGNVHPEYSGFLTDAYIEHDKRKNDLLRKARKRVYDMLMNEQEMDSEWDYKQSIPQSYKEQLNDIRWQAFRLFVLTARGTKCEMCGSTENVIHIHHNRYIFGKKAWEYTCNDVEVLCSYCHKKIHDDNKK